MNCKINEQTVVNKCAEVAQQVHEDFINDNTGEFSKENDDIQMFAEPEEFLKAGEIREYVSLCRSLNMSDKDIAKILIANKLFGQRFEELFNTKEIQDVAQEEGPRARALEVFRDCLGDGIDFESFVKGLLARKDKSTFEKKDAYNSILKKNFPIFKSVKSGKTTFAATAEAVQQAYRDGNDKSDNLGADLINAFVNEFSSLRELNDAIFGKKRKLSVSERLDYAADIITDELEEQNYFKKKRQSIVSQLITHLKNIGIPVFFKKDMEKYFREHPNSSVQDYVRLKMQSNKDIAKEVLYNHYLGNTKPTQEQIRDYKRFQNAFVGGKYIYSNDKSLDIQSKELQERFPNAIIYDGPDTKYAFAKDPTEVLREKNKKWIDELSDEQLFDEAFRLSEEEMFVTKNGEIYGFVDKNGNIYLDEKIINAEHPIHEYTHLWDRVVAKNNPELWEKGVALMKHTELWNDIANDERYGRKWMSMTNMSEDKIENLIASEVHARLVGQKGQNIIGENGDINVIEKLKQWLLDFWKELKATFSNWSKEEIERLTLEDFNNMTLRDFADGINPIEQKQKQTEQVQQENEQQAQKQQDKSPIVDGDKYEFNNKAEADEFERRLNEMFPIPNNESVTYRVNDTTVILKRIFDVVRIYDLKSNIGKRSFKANTENATETTKSYNTIVGNENNKRLVSNLRSQLKNTEALLNNYFKKYNNPNANKLERAEVIRNYKILSLQRDYIEKALYNLDIFDTDSIVKNVDNILEMFERIYDGVLNTHDAYNTLFDITDPVIMSVFRDLHNLANSFFEKYGQEGNQQLNKINDRELIEKIDEQIKKWIDYKNKYNQLTKQIIDKMLDIAEGMRRGSNFKTGLRAHWRANFDKQLRQGLKDLGFGQTFFAFDNAMKENTAIPKILTMLTEKVDIECFNEFFEINKRFDVVIDKLRSIGVNLNDKKSWGKYFIERFKNGTETGNLISCFTPEFRMFMSKFFNTNPKSFINITQEDEKLQRKKLRQFIDTLDVVNIFKLKEAHNPNNILYKMLEVLSRNVVRENFGDDGSTIGFDFYGKQWSELSQQSEYAYDEEYENEIKKKLGPDFNRVITQYINLFTQTFEQRDENFDVMRNNVTMENNPFYIMKHLVDSKRTNNDSNVTGPNHAFYNYNKMIYIPSDSKYYNQQFAEMFNESNPNRDVFSEAYNLFMEIYGDIVGSMYFSDANNTAYAKIVYDGILRSNHKGFINIVKKLWDDLRSTFLRDKVVEKDPTKINKNYSDEYRAIYNKIYSSLAGMSASQILNMAADWGIDTDQIRNEEVNTIRSIVANEITSRQSDFDTDFVKSTKNILRLYAVQKKNNIMTEYATAMRDKFAEFKINPNANDGPENTRVKALESYDDQVSRGFKQQGRPKHAKKIKEDEVERIKKEIKDSLEDGLDINDQIESLIKANKRHLMSNEKKIVEKLIDILQSASNVANYDHSFSFIYKEKEYSFFIDNRYGKQYRRNGKAITPEEFVDAREEYIMEKILDFGSECGLDSVVDGISTITRLKMLGGYVSALIPGFKNRVDGLVADADLDATWRYFTPGNLAWAQRFLWGSMLPIGLVNNEGGMLIKGFSKDSAKRFQITKIIGDRLRVFQDMSNTLDKNISKSTFASIKSNLNPYNIAIQFPEIRNQFDLLIAILHDYTVKDKDGKEHRFVDTVKGVMCYTMLDVDKNGNLFLKDEFNPDLYEEGTLEYENTKNNKQWITFDTEMESSSRTRRMTGKKDLSDVSRISIDHMNANKRANGDYREALKKLYSKNTFWRMVMNLKTFAPERFKRAWSQGNNEDLIGEYTTLWEYGGLISWGTIVYNAFQSASEKYNLSRSHILPRRLTAMAVGLTNATVAVGMMTVIKKVKPNIKLYHRVLFDLKYLKSLLYEQITFLPRFAGMKTNPVKFTFKDNDKIFKENEVIPQVNETTEEVLYREEKMEDEIRMHKGNVAALARSVARSTYGLAFKVALVYVGTKVIKGMFGGDDDDTEYNKKKNIDPKVNFLVNTLKNVSESCSLLYQMSFGVMDMYKSVVMFSLIEKISDGVQKMHDLEYEEGAEKLAEVAFPMRTTLWKKFSSDYKGRETNWAMAAEALNEENLDEEDYYDKYFEKKNRQLKKKLKDAYMEVFEEGKKEYDAKKKEGESFDAHYLKDGFSSDEMNDLENFFRKKNKKARENKIEIGDDWSLYDLNEDQFKKLIDSFLPRNDGNTEDLYGNKHKTTNRKMIQTYQEWFRNSESLKKPLALEAFDENPSFLMDIVRLINDGKDTEENTNIKNLNNERAERERRLREAGL